MYEAGKCSVVGNRTVEDALEVVGDLKVVIQLHGAYRESNELSSEADGCLATSGLS